MLKICNDRKMPAKKHGKECLNHRAPKFRPTKKFITNFLQTFIFSIFLIKFVKPNKKLLAKINF